jgi:hypothetical protein
VNSRCLWTCDQPEAAGSASSQTRRSCARLDRRKVGRLKPNGQLAAYSPLSPLLELESLHLRIDDKIDVWNALRSSVGDRVNGIDFDERGPIGRDPHQHRPARRRPLMYQSMS